MIGYSVQRKLLTDEGTSYIAAMTRHAVAIILGRRRSKTLRLRYLEPYVFKEDKPKAAA